MDIIDLLFLEHKKHLESIDKLQNLFKNARTILNEKTLSMLQEELQEVCLDLKLHFQKEEEGLFPFLYEKIKNKDNLLKELIGEHKIIQDLCDKSLKNISFIKQGVNQWPELRNNINELLHYLNDHILKENTILFKMCIEYLDKETLIKGFSIAEDIEKKFFS